MANQRHIQGKKKKIFLQLLFDFPEILNKLETNFSPLNFWMMTNLLRHLICFFTLNIFNFSFLLFALEFSLSSSEIKFFTIKYIILFVKQGTEQTDLLCFLQRIYCSLEEVGSTSQAVFYYPFYDFNEVILIGSFKELNIESLKSHHISNNQKIKVKPKISIISTHQIIILIKIPISSSPQKPENHPNQKSSKKSQSPK